MGGYTIHKNTYKSVIVNLITKYMRIYCKKLQTKIPGLVRGGGGEKKTNCDWIDLKSRGSFLSLRRYIGGSRNIPKNT